MEDIFATFEDNFEWLPEFDLDFSLEFFLDQEILCQ